MVPTAYDIKCPGRLGSDSTDVCVPSEVLAISVDRSARSWKLRRRSDLLFEVVGPAVRQLD